MVVVPTESESNSSGEEEEGPASSEMSSTKATSSQEGELHWGYDCLRDSVMILFMGS